MEGSLMDIQKIRAIIDEILHHIIYVNSEMNDDIENKYRELIDTFKNKDYIYDDLKQIVVEKIKS